MGSNVIYYHDILGFHGDLLMNNGDFDFLIFPVRMFHGNFMGIYIMINNGDFRFHEDVMIFGD